MDTATGQWMQAMAAQDIADQGVPVTLPGNNVKLAMQLFDLHEIMKYIAPDGELMTRGKVVCVFVFAGTLLNSINKNDQIVANGQQWRAQDIYPSWIGGVCTQLAVACFAPGG